jgi:hypothetical protein
MVSLIRLRFRNKILGFLKAMCASPACSLVLGKRLVVFQVILNHSENHCIYFQPEVADLAEEFKPWRPPHPRLNR